MHTARLVSQTRLPLSIRGSEKHLVFCAELCQRRHEMKCNVYLRTLLTHTSVGCINANAFNCFFIFLPVWADVIHCLQLQQFNKVAILVSVIFLLNRVHLIFHRLRWPALTRCAKRMDWFGTDIGLCERDASSNPSRNRCIIAILGDGRSFLTGHSQSARLYEILLQSSRRRAWTCPQIDWIFTDAWSIDWQRFRLDQDQSEYTRFSQMQKFRTKPETTKADRFSLSSFIALGSNKNVMEKWRWSPERRIEHRGSRHKEHPSSDFGVRIWWNLQQK